ncbi:hypothetical protein [Haloferula rosea]|uniref:Uncharacterized protein n=1 Tax=Haloferula rosea TaxID=490093 RepID=A0A934VCN9_9BACT|nr:hypothetical protein [Haloferula rosea]MBK1825439.1 hypothetical protein [Haloferula rosea]
MKLHEVEEVRACLSKGRTLFSYGKDWYAVELLKLCVRGETSVADLKQSAFGRLFDKQRVRQWFGSLGKTKVSREDLELLWPEEWESYRLKLDAFDGWTQTSRKGDQAWNLVLQLNLNEADARLMDAQFEDRSDDPFEWACHPVHEGRHRTLAWARIDLDWESGEALIEEVQNDRLREVKLLLDRARSLELEEVDRWGVTVKTSFLEHYWEKRLRLSRAVWDEAMVCATIRFIVGELGLRRVFFHTPESGRTYKDYGYSEPPRSVYTDLPKKFCFKRVAEMPEFLRRRFKKRPQVDFQLLEF